MPRLIIAFDDATELERALAGLDELGLAGRIRVIEALARRAEQPLPPEVGGASGVPIATPTAATGRDVAPGGAEPHPEGLHGPTYEDLVRLVGGDTGAALRYQALVSAGGALLVIEGRESELDEAQKLLADSRGGRVSRHA